MPTVAEVWGWISSYQQNVNDCENKIARLKPVYQNLGEVKSRFQSARKNTENVFKETESWDGEKHTAFCNAGSALDDACGDYYRRLDAAQDAVNRKIHELEAKKLEMIPIINNLYALIEQIEASVENTFNG